MRQVDELSKTNSYNDTLHRYRSQSFSEQRTTLRNLKNSGSTSTRDMGTMCGVMTRDVGVSYQPVRIAFPFNRRTNLYQSNICLRGIYKILQFYIFYLTV